jgi:hypothetical protein
MKVHVKVEALLHSFLTQALDGAEWSASYPGQFTTRGNVPYILRRLSTLQAVLMPLEKRKFFVLARN